MFLGKSRSSARALVGLAAVFCVVAMIPSPARAAFHLWSIQQIYSDSSGNLQFIELFDGAPNDTFGFQNAVNTMQIHVSNSANTITNTFTIPGNPLPGNTLNHTLLFGTAGIQAAGAPAPDYILPNNFLFSAGGSINFFGINAGALPAGAYPALPTDGHMSYNWVAGTTGQNMETNYSGQSGSISPVPEPSAVLLTCLAAGGMYRWLRRRPIVTPCPGQPNPQST
jgi:hypothetical protein